MCSVDADEAPTLCQALSRTKRQHDLCYKEGELDRSQVGKQDSVEETFPKEVMTE